MGTLIILSHIVSRKENEKTLVNQNPFVWLYTGSKTQLWTYDPIKAKPGLASWACDLSSTQDPTPRRAHAWFNALLLPF